MATRVLIVDDERELCALWSEVLADSGYEVSTFGSLADLQRGLDQSLSWDVAVIDWTLPDAKGPDVVRLLRSAGVDCPVVFASGLGPMLPDGHGGARVLGKPFRIRDLLRAVEDLTPGG